MEYVPGFFLVLSEVVERQGFFLVVDVVDDVVYIVEVEQGEYGPENFFAHDAVFGEDAGYYGGGDIEVFVVVFASGDDVSLLEQEQEVVEMVLADNAGVVGAFLGGFPVLSFDLCL